MKKFIIIGFIVALVVVGILLRQHSKHPSDAKLGQQISGTWKNHSGLFTRVFSSDGSFSTIIGHPNALVTYQGTWLVKDGELVMTLTNAQGTGSHQAGSSVGDIDRIRIVQVDEHQFSYAEGGRGGGTITLSH